MAIARKPSKRPTAQPKRKTAKPAPRLPAATTVSPKAFAAALARIDALERQIARLAALPLSVTSGGDVTIEAGAVLLLRAPTIKLECTATLQAQSSQFSLATGLANVDTGMFRVSGVVKCDTLQTNTVIASTYTPGAGNVW